MFKSFKHFNPEITIQTTQRNICLYKFEVIQIFNQGYPRVLLSGKDGFIEPYCEYHMSTKTNTAFTQPFRPVLPSISAIHEEPVYFFLYNVKNYYHFIYDTLPYLWLYIHQKMNCSILVEKDLLPFVKETFALLDLERKLVTFDPSVLYKTIYISSSLTHDGASNRPPNEECKTIIQMLKFAALSKASLLDVNVNKKMYVSRRTNLLSNTDKQNIGTDYTQRRVCRSEDKLVEFLSSQGYEEVFPERWSMTKKILAFMNATHVVGLIGGGVCNLIFSSNYTQSVVIVSPTFLDVNYRFQYSMNHTQLTYFTATDLIYLNSESKISLYMRAKTRSGAIGEIVGMEGTKVELMMSSEGSVYVLQSSSREWVELNDVEILDRGLNSPFDLDMIKFKEVWNL